MEGCPCRDQPGQRRVTGIWQVGEPAVTTVEVKGSPALGCIEVRSLAQGANTSRSGRILTSAPRLERSDLLQQTLLLRLERRNLRRQALDGS